jgi:hypothetical protein
VLIAPVFQFPRQILFTLLAQELGRALAEFWGFCISPQKGSIQDHAAKAATVPIRISANSRRISSRLTGREPMRVEGRKARSLDVAGYRAKGVRAARTDALTAAVAVGPFLPAAPDNGQCDVCDYRVVCGPHEERRTARKAQGSLEPLLAVRALP